MSGIREAIEKVGRALMEQPEKARSKGVPATSRLLDGLRCEVKGPNGEALLTLRGHEEPVTAVCFDPTGATLASASRDGTIRLWRTSALPENPH